MTPTTHTHRLLARALPRGESLVAWIGLGAAAIMVAALVAATAWSMHAQRDSQRDNRKTQTITIARLLSQSVEGMLAANEVSALRSSVAGVAAQYNLAQIQVLVPDKTQTVIADSLGRAKYEPMPAAWTELKPVLTEMSVFHSPRTTEVRVPLNIPNKGPVVLTVRAEGDFPLWRGWEAQVGAGVIGVVGLSCLWLAYRSARSRLRGVGAVREALQALSSGETDAAALSVAPTLGPEAVAWNRLVSEAEQLRQRMMQDRVSERLGNRRGGETELHSVCDALWQGLVLVDEKLSIKYANGAAGVFLGMSRDELNGKDATLAIKDADVLSATRKIAGGMSRSRTALEVTRSTPGGTISSVLRFTIRPVRRADGGGALVVIEDMTQQKVADDSRNAFVASATHELRTPLTNMRLYVDRLIEEPGLDAASREQSLNIVSGEIRRLERLVSDMLSMAEIEAGQLKVHRDDVRLESIFEELKGDFEEQARSKSIALKFELPPKWPQMTGDRDKIVLAMHNLVGNAIKYTPDGGSVTVRVQSDGSTLVVEVIDTGIGIADEEVGLVFDKFYRARDARVSKITGTGLGLAIAREVIRLHGGDVSVRSQVDKGSTFTVSLPLAA